MFALIFFFLNATTRSFHLNSNHMKHRTRTILQAICINLLKQGSSSSPSHIHVKIKKPALIDYQNLIIIKKSPDLNSMTKINRKNLPSPIEASHYTSKSKRLQSKLEPEIKRIKVIAHQIAMDYSNTNDSVRDSQEKRQFQQE